MEIREIDIYNMKGIYESYMVKDFPADELKSLSLIESLMKKKNYKCFGMFHNDELSAYAFLYFNDLSLSFFIDYYAVVGTKRNMGYGSQFLTLLKEEFYDYNGFFLEVEKVESAQNEEDRKIREKRVQFYLKNNGMKKTSVSSCVTGVDFDILYQPLKKKLDNSFVYNGLKEVYSSIFPKNLYNNIVVNMNKE